MVAEVRWTAGRRGDPVATRPPSPSREDSVALFRRNSGPTTEPEPVAVADDERAGVGRKVGPTPTRRAAEAARRERVNPSLSPKQARALRARQQRQERAKAMEAREATPEKQLLRNWVDSRRNLGEFLLPSLVVLLALQFLSSLVPDMIWISTVVMYVFIGVVILDIVMMWRGFRKLLARRMPNGNPKGLLMHGAMRATQIRRFRMPPAQVERGAKL